MVIDSGRMPGMEEPLDPLYLAPGGDAKDGGGSSAYPASLSTTKDWKYTRMLVLGNRKEHLKQDNFQNHIKGDIY